jgi:hypothetical protein
MKDAKKEMIVILCFYCCIAAVEAVHFLAPFKHDDVYDVYKRTVVMGGEQGAFIRRQAYTAYANCYQKTGDKAIARKHGMDVIQQHIFEIFNVIPSPNRPTAEPSACLGRE